MRVIALKGFALPEAISDAVLATADDVAPVVERLVAEGLVVASAGAYTLTDAGRSRVDRLRVAERSAWGAQNAIAALDAFLAIDHHVKDVVTAWQMRDAQTVNDHTDAAYDAGVLDRLAAIHADAMTWVGSITPGVPRFRDYAARLSRAIDAAKSGDGRFIASPRVDSYHGIWFELHEDLIQLAGRTREEESAAGRA
jgi:pyruvate,orthophosphate dikinase